MAKRRKVGEASIAGISNSKYKFTGEQMTMPDGVILWRIESVKDMASCKKGTVGGWIEEDGNLSEFGDCWVGEDAKVWGGAMVTDNAYVGEEALVHGRVLAEDNSYIDGHADVSGFVALQQFAAVGGAAKVIGGQVTLHDRVTITDGVLSGSLNLDGDFRLDRPITINDHLPSAKRSDGYPSTWCFTIGKHALSAAAESDLHLLNQRQRSCDVCLPDRNGGNSSCVTTSAEIMLSATYSSCRTKPGITKPSMQGLCGGAIRSIWRWNYRRWANCGPASYSMPFSYAT